MPKYTFTDADNRPDSIPAGIYVGTVISAKEKISKASGNDMIELLWNIDDNNAHVFDNLVFTEKSAWKIDTFLKATGHAPESKGAEVNMDVEAMIGWRSWLNIGVEDDRLNEGQKRNKILQYITNKGAAPEKPF